MHVPTIKPLDEDALWQQLDGISRVFTVEEHSVIGGLGDVVSGILSAHGAGARQTRIGLADAWSESAPNDFLLDKYGLSPAKVTARIAAELQASQTGK